MAAALKSLTAQAGQLKAQGRLDEAVRVYRQAAEAFPESGVAHHNLAGALGDLGAYEEAVSSCEAAFKAGLKAPETWLVLARSQMQLGEFELSRKAFDAVIAQRPDMAIAHYERAQLVWMNTVDPSEALSSFDQALVQAPGHGGLVYMRAKALEYMGDLDGATDQMAQLARTRPTDLMPQVAASYLCAQSGDLASAGRFAAQALQLAPGEPVALNAAASACLAQGDAGGAAALARKALDIQQDDQNALALLATAWRLAGDERGGELYDYTRFVRAYQIDPPEGWSDRSGYLSDLVSELTLAHPFKTHPFGQSVRHGSQRSNILNVKTPAISAFAKAVDPLIQRYVQDVGTGTDPLRRRNTGRWRRDGIWSVWLKPGGYHHDHVHPSGWLSSAFYARLPSAVTGKAPQGWIKFGAPGQPVHPQLQAEYYVKPEPGMLVLFPSYMWHGTVPFEGKEPRLTLAMDLVPG